MQDKEKGRVFVNKERILCPSMMCASFSNLEEDTRNLEKADIDIFHIDIMDGTFVPNFGMGIQDLELIRKATTKTIDVHLMITEPSKYVEMFADMGADIIYIHPEADLQPARTLSLIHDKGKKVGLAINPGTSIETIKELFFLIDYLMIMTVNPGFSGQSYLDYVNTKIEKAVSYAEVYDFKVMVDGAISSNKIDELSSMGVSGFVLGTSALFGREGSYKEIVNELRQ